LEKEKRIEEEIGSQLKTLSLHYDKDIQYNLAYGYITRYKAIN